MEVSWQSFSAKDRAAQALPEWPNVLSLGSKPQQATNSPSGQDTGQSRLAKAVQRKSSGFKSLLTSYSEAAWLSYKPLSKPNKQLLDRCAHLHSSSHGPWLKRSACCRPGTACPSQ